MLVLSISYEVGRYALNAYLPFLLYLFNVVGGALVNEVV